MNLVYLFLVYKNPDILLHTITRLSSSNVRFYIHIDATSKEDFSCLYDLDNVYISDVRYKTDWGGYNIILAIIHSLHDIQKKCMGDYVILMSESDYPVKSNEYIYNFLEKEKRDFIRITPLPHPNPLNTPGGKWLENGRRRYECYALRLRSNSLATIEPRVFNIGNLRHFVKVLRYNPLKIFNAMIIWGFLPKRRHPAFIAPCGGDLWCILRKNTILSILEFCDNNNDFIQYCKNSSNLDELFIPTLVNHLVKDGKLENHLLRYINWKDNNSSSPMDITMKDLDIISECVMNSNCLFVRKVQDAEVCCYIDDLLSD